MKVSGKILAVAVAAGLAGRAAAAGPVMGSFSISPGIGAALVSGQELKDFYGPNLSGNSTVVAGALGGGIDYNVSDNVQLGVRYDRVIKAPTKVTLKGTTFDEVDTWAESANAFLGHGRFLVRGANPNSWFAISLALGQYALAGATAKYEFTNGATGSGTSDLSGSVFGGEVMGEYEHSFGGQVTSVVGLGWRFARFTKVTIANAGRSAELENADGSRGTIDLGGVNATFTLRFYFGGSGSSVSSY